ncbi:DUF6194 family protein [Nocardiopsis sediminis]|uniref:DUF6194 family protein n=1 Tax=Nocardiopsis sediminis TaxID=1778267 RepID=A0ABV8FIG7_9ACTN
MDADDLKRHICETFEGVSVVESSGDLFFSYDPDGDVVASEQWTPFATIVTGDTYDGVSDLSRPGDHRLNIGLTKATYTARFGAPPRERGDHGVLDTGFDYAVRDEVLPHPLYASQYWVCVVNPGRATLDEEVAPLLAEAYERAVRAHAARRARRARRARA